jgi:hypothetical protein
MMQKQGSATTVKLELHLLSETKLFYGLVLLLFACAGPKKAALSSGEDTSLAVAEAEQLRTKTQQEQVDLLAFEQYMDGVKILNKEKIGLDRNFNKDIILGNAAIAKAHFIEASELSTKRRSNATRIIQDRQSALTAGLRNSRPLVEALLDVDDDFSKALNPQDFSEFQKRYLTLEVKAVQYKKLDCIRVAIQKATKFDAEDLASETLKTAMLDLSEAENFIAQSPRNPEVHQQRVTISEASAILLSDVMDVILNVRGTPEPVALKIVEKNRKLGMLEQNLKSTQSDLMKSEVELGLQNEELKTTKSNLMGIEGTLKQKNEELARSSTQVRYQNAMDEARRNFSDDDASVYQQGANLIFRLKK